MRPPKKQNLDHFFETVSLDEDITDLRTKFVEWETADGRGKSSVWTLLGKAYELVSTIAKDDRARCVLIAKVSEDSNVQKSNQWDPARKHPFDLLLVLLLGLKNETKATKSQWLRTLNAAEKGKVAATQNDFVGWIKNTGGIDGVLKPSQRPAQERKTISQLAEGLEPEFDFNGKAITIPKSSMNFQNDELPEGFALVLVRESDEDGKIWPLATITDEKQIAAAIKSVFVKHKQVERENSRQLRQTEALIIKRVRQAAKKPYNMHKKSVPTPNTFDEFLEEFISDFPHHVPSGYEYLFQR